MNRLEAEEYFKDIYKKKKNRLIFTVTHESAEEVKDYIFWRKLTFWRNRVYVILDAMKIKSEQVDNQMRVLDTLIVAYLK